MSPIETAELRRLAEAATKGEWAVDGYNMSAVIFRQHGKTSVTDWMRLARCDADNANWKADAAYIASASPDVVLSLLDDNAALSERVERLEAALRKAPNIVAQWAGTYRMKAEEYTALALGKHVYPEIKALCETALSHPEKDETP